MGDRIEQAYKTMSASGYWNIAIGIGLIVISVFAGTVSIVNGLLLLRKKSGLTF